MPYNRQRTISKRTAPPGSMSWRSRGNVLQGNVAAMPSVHGPATGLPDLDAAIVTAAC
jgi:hypothetical protein